MADAALYLDLEAWNEQGVSDGSYACAGIAQVLLLAYDSGEGSAQVWDATQETFSEDCLASG